MSLFYTIQRIFCGCGEEIERRGIVKMVLNQGLWDGTRRRSVLEQVLVALRRVLFSIFPNFLTSSRPEYCATFPLLQCVHSTMKVVGRVTQHKGEKMKSLSICFVSGQEYQHMDPTNENCPCLLHMEHLRSSGQCRKKIQT